MVSRQVLQSPPVVKSLNIGDKIPEFEIICTDHCQPNLEHKITSFSIMLETIHIEFQLTTFLTSNIKQKTPLKVI